MEIETEHVTPGTDRTWAEIDLGAIAHNVREMRRVLPDGCTFLAVVKADGYGHGSVPVAKAALDAGAGYLAVACLDEARVLRDAGIQVPILLLGVTPPWLVEELVRLDVQQAVGSLSYAQSLSAMLEKTGHTLFVHWKLDTGMSRTGLDAVHEGVLAEHLPAALALPHLHTEGMFTHFAVSDEPGGEAFTQQQFAHFREGTALAEQCLGRRISYLHCCNSGGVLSYLPDMALDMVRPGIMLYGLYPGQTHGDITLRPALSLKSRVYAITQHYPGDTVSYGRTFTIQTPTRLAVLPIGYADGLHRNLSGKIDVLLHGTRCPQVGRICMDMCMVDVSHLPDCREGDIATLIGRDGDVVLTADDMAHASGTISYEITCNISPRVPRIYT